MTATTRIVAVTGATGFVGGALVRTLANRGHSVRAIVRQSGARWPAGVAEIAVGDLDAVTDWSAALTGVDAVVHCAARAHQLDDRHADPLAEFRRVNAEASVNLGRQAAAAGVRRLVFLSSIGVHGGQTQGRPFRADDPPAPHSPYAVSKLEAEKGLRQLAAQSAIELVIVRPPLVYGPDAPGNFARLLRAVQSGWPLPLGAVDNRRSFIGLDNLLDLLILCLDHPDAPGTWLASDDDDVSTTELLRRMAQALGRPSRLLPVPGSWLCRLLEAAGRHELAQRLFGSLQVDIGQTRRRLQWTPPVTMLQQLEAIAGASGQGPATEGHAR